MSKSKPPTDDAKPRYVPPGSCTWCAHKPHTGECPASIRLAKDRNGPCPCARRGP